MKNLRIITGLLIILLGLYIGSKTVTDTLFPPSHSITVSLLGDISDPGLMDETPADIVNFFPLDDDHLYDGFVFRSRVISESNDHNVCEYAIKPVRWWEANSNERVAELRIFKSSVCKEIDRMENEEITPKKNSLVYEGFVQEATILSQSKSDRKVLICMSDMLQSSDDFSFYKYNDFMQAKTDPKGVIARFQKIAPLPRLNGVSIYFLHRCRSYQEQKQYDVAVNIFVQLATQAGATDIHVGTNISSHE